MKTCRMQLLAGLGSILVSFSVSAQPAPATSPAAGSATEISAPKLPYGVDDVLKLSRAQISEDIILNYVQSSGTVYNLAPKDIVYLRNEGVSDRVINTMLEQRKRGTEVAVQTAQPTQQPAPAAPPTTPPPTYYTGQDQSAPAAAPSYAPTYVQPPAQQPAPSTVYVIPSPQVQYAYYGPYYRPYYPSYYGGYYGGYWGPSLSFGFNFGGHGHSHHGWHHR